MMTRPPMIPRTNLKGLVASEIRDRIFSGELRPGNKIDQDQLSRELEVSRLPVREALIALEQEALVRNVPRRGAFVADLSHQDIRDHFVIYGHLAALAAEQAASELSSEEIDGLRQILAKMKDIDNNQALADLNYEFHRIINRGSRSPRLLLVLRLLSKGMPARFFESIPEWSPHAHEDHSKMLKALESRDGDAAARATLEHFSASADVAVNVLEKRNFWDRP